MAEHFGLDFFRSSDTIDLVSKRTPIITGVILMVLTRFALLPICFGSDDSMKPAALHDLDSLKQAQANQGESVKR
jgi:hypothetical protein